MAVAGDDQAFERPSPSRLDRRGHRRGGLAGADDDRAPLGGAGRNAREPLGRRGGVDRGVKQGGQKGAWFVHALPTIPRASRDIGHCFGRRTHPNTATSESGPEPPASPQATSTRFRRAASPSLRQPRSRRPFRPCPDRTMNQRRGCAGGVHSENPVFVAVRSDRAHHWLEASGRNGSAVSLSRKRPDWLCRAAMRSSSSSTVSNAAETEIIALDASRGKR